MPEAGDIFSTDLGRFVFIRQNIDGTGEVCRYEDGKVDMEIIRIPLYDRERGWLCKIHGHIRPLIAHFVTEATDAGLDKEQ